MNNLDTGVKLWEPSPQIFGTQPDPTPTPFYAPLYPLEESLPNLEVETSFEALPLVEPEDKFWTTRKTFRIVGTTQMEAITGLKIWPDRGTLHSAGLSAQLPWLDRVILRSVAAPSLLREPALPDQANVIGRIDEICKNLRLGLRVAASLVGVSVRRYHELRTNGRLPPERLREAADVANALDRFAASDPELVAELFATNEDDAVSLLTTGHYADFAERLSGLREAHARELAALPAAADPIELPKGQALRDLVALVRNPLFKKAVDWTRRRAVADAFEDKTWWLEQKAALQQAFEQFDAADPVDDQFEFILTLNSSQRADFYQSANSFLDDPAHGPADWSGFVAAESERAFDAYDPYVAPPSSAWHADDEREVIDDEGDDIDFFERLGVDSSTGWPIRRDS